MLNKVIEWDQKLNGDRAKSELKERNYLMGQTEHLDGVKQNLKDRRAKSKMFLSICVTGFQDEK